MLMAAAFFGQTLEPKDWAVIGLLIVLEGVLSIDNALVLGLLAKRLPKRLQRRALTYGLVGAFVFRILAIATAAWLLHWRVVKLIGGGYLVYIAVKHLFFESTEEQEEEVVATAEGIPGLVDKSTGAPLSADREDLEIRERTTLPIPERCSDEQVAAGDCPETAAATAQPPATDKANWQFWKTVIVIELTDIAFAIDSILAAIALVGGKPVGHVGPHPKLWVVITGGMLGVILMRYAAVIFIRLLEKFPRFETAAYLLVIVIGGKLLVDWKFNYPPPDIQKAIEAGQIVNWHPPFDFHSPSSPAFWVFWVLMILCFCVGFLPKKKTSASARV